MELNSLINGKTGSQVNLNGTLTNDVFAEISTRLILSRVITNPDCLDPKILERRGGLVGRPLFITVVSRHGSTKGGKIHYACFSWATHVHKIPKCSTGVVGVFRPSIVKLDPVGAIGIDAVDYVKLSNETRPGIRFTKGT